MTDPGGPQRHKLCFLSTLLSQKVPEKSDVVLRCMIAGHPKPEVTWYKNGHALGESGNVSSYEFFEDQYVYLLHLSCCTQSDAAVYQVSATSCLGMICSSAVLEVEHPPRKPQVSPDLRDGSDAGGERETETQEEESAKETDEKGQPYKEEESVCPVALRSADSSPSEFSHFPSWQTLANHDVGASSCENPLDVKACHPNNIQEIVFSSNNTPENQDGCHCRTAQASVSGLMGGGPGDKSSNDEVFTSGHLNAKAQKYISFSLSLSEATVCASPGDGALVNTQPGPQVSSDSDSDYELCPEITLTCTEEFSDDDLEYLECSDVMTDYSNTLWQRSLQGTDPVFLLESDGDEVEFGECGLGVWEPFLSEMGPGPQVSDDTRPMEATTGFWCYQSQLQEVGVRSSGASGHSPSPLPTDMTLTLGPHQNGTAMVAEPGRCPLPTAPEAAENDCSGIEGETRDSQESEEEFTSDSLLTMGEAATEGEVKPSSGDLDKSGLKQASESLAGERSEEKLAGSRRGAPRSMRMRRPGMKANAKKLLLRESALEGTLDHPPEEPTTQQLVTQSDQRQTVHTKAKAPGWNSHFHEEQCGAPTPAEQDPKPLGPPADSLSTEVGTRFKGGGMLVSNLFEPRQAPEQSDHLQMQIRETLRERSSPSQKPAFSTPPGEASSFTGTTRDFFSNLKEINKENESFTQCLELKSCGHVLQQEDRQNREGTMLVGPWTEVTDEQRVPESNVDIVLPTLPSATCLPQDVSTLCGEPVASPEPADPSLTLEDVCSGSRGREAGAQGTCYDTMDSPVDKYWPQDIGPVDFELTEGQSKVHDLCPPDVTLAVLHGRAAGPPQATCEGSKRGDWAASPLLTGAVTQGAYLEEGENPLPILSSAAQGGPHNSGGLLSSENSSSEPLSEGGDESPIIRAPDATAEPASHSWFLREPPTALTADTEHLQVTREVEDTPLVMPTNVSPTKNHAASVSENDFVDRAGESSPKAPTETHFQFPSNVQLGHVLTGSTNESTEKLLGLVPRVPGDPGHILQLPGEEGLYSSSVLQPGNDSGDESQMVDRADGRSRHEDFQEKGSEIEQRFQPQRPSCQASLSAHDFQESLPPTSVMQEEASVLGHSPANSREERGLSSDLEMGVSMVTETNVEDGQFLSQIPSLAEIFLGEKKHTGLGSWEAGNKVKIITLEASDFEIWPPGQVTESEYKEVEAGPMGPGRDWALPDILKAGATTMLEPSPLGVAVWARSPRAETAAALGNDRESREGDTQTRDTHWGNLASQCLDQPRLLESSVDPIEEKELDVIDTLSEMSEMGGKEGVNSMSQVQEEHRLKVDHPILVNQFLNSPDVLESSVDPIHKDGMEGFWDEQPEVSKSIREGSDSQDGDSGQRVEAHLALLQVSRPQDGGEAIPDDNRPHQDQVAREQEESKRYPHNGANMEVQADVRGVLCPAEGGQGIPGACSKHRDRSLGDTDLTFPTSPLSGHLTVMTDTPAEVDTHSSTGQIQGDPEPGSPQYVFSELKERETVENTCGKHVPTSSDLMLTHLPCVSSPKGNVTHLLMSHSTEEPKMEVPLIGDTEGLSPSSSPTMNVALISRECQSERAPEFLQDLCQKGPPLGNGKRSSHVGTQTGKSPGARSEVVRKKQEASGSGHLAEGMKKKILSKVAALRLRLEEKENVPKNSGLLKKIPKLEKSLSRSDERREPKKTPCKWEGKAPVLLRKIQAEMAPDRSGNVRLSCQFAEIHEDSTIWWTKDSKSIAQVQRRAGDNSSVSLAIAQAGQKDQGLYYCGITNSYGRVTAEFNLTAEVLRQLSRHMESRGCEEIEFSQLIFREDFLRDSYFGDRLRGQISTEELHFGEGVHRKAFRSTVMQGLLPVFQPGHACVLKVHNAIAHGTRDSEELIQKNYKLAAQECYVQNTARHYAKIYAAEAQPLEGFGEVPEVIPVFLIHRPENNIPYATVEEELIGDFVKYSIRDGKEINFLRRDSEAGQKCCTFQHWVYQKTSGCLLVTDMQGVGMKLTDVGIATLAKGYKGFKGNCSMTFIEQFKALHQCNKFCKMLGLKSLQSSSQKPKKANGGKSRVQTNTPTARMQDSGMPAERKVKHPSSPSH